MQTKNALSNLKNRYIAVLKKCNLINIFGALALATMCAMPATAFSATNPEGSTVAGMEATAADPNLNNNGNISGGTLYTISPVNTYFTGMFGYNSGNINYNFNNSGNINVSNISRSYGMYAEADTGNHTLTNSGNLNVSSTASSIYGMYTFAQNGSHNLTNSGSMKISGSSDVYGIYAFVRVDGSHTAINNGNLEVIGTGSNIYGINIQTLATGSHTLTNNGYMKVISDLLDVYGMSAFAADGSHKLTNNGYMQVSGSDYVYGMYASVNNVGSHTLSNSGSMTVSSSIDNNIYGMYAYADTGSHTLSNSGSMTVSSSIGYNIYGMYAEADTGSHTLSNSGSMTVSSTGNSVYGMYAKAVTGDHKLANSGTINLSGNDTVTAMWGEGAGNHTLTNSGTITVNGLDSAIVGMRADGAGNHTLTNSGIIEVNSSGSEAFGMFVRGSGNHLVNNTGIITTKALGTPAETFEVIGLSSYSVGTWATTLRTWSDTDAVFRAAGADLNFANSTLILRPGTEAQGFEFGKEYNVGNQADGMAAGSSTISGTIAKATTEVPFLKATLSNGHDPLTATVRLETNINDETITGSASAQGNLAVVQGQMSNISRKLLQTKYNELYINLVSENGTNSNSGISAGSAMNQNKWTLFATPYGSYTNNNEYNFDGSQMGVTGGASYAFNDKFSLGGHFDFNASDYSADIFAMDTDSTSMALGLHAMYNIMPHWYVGAQATGSISNIESEYSLTTGVANSKADYDSQALYLALNSGYMFEVAKGHTLTPQIGVSYLNMNTDSYDILWGSGYSMYDMHYDSTSYSAFYVDFALNWRSEWLLKDESTLALLAGAGVRQNLSGSDIDSDFRVLGAEYSTRASQDDTTFLADLGVEWSKDNVGVSLAYNGEYGSEQTSHTGSLNFTYKF